MVRRRIRVPETQGSSPCTQTKKLDLPPTESGEGRRSTKLDTKKYNMKFKFKKDKRNPYWKKLELRIQKNAAKKDKKFILTGPWKKFLEKRDGIKIYLVDGNWIRNNLYGGFNHGGHGYVCEYIPLDEIWVLTTHPVDCKCKHVKPNRMMSKNFRKSLILHEFTERNLMAKGMIYWKAHQLAEEVEKKAGYIRDPYSDI